MFGLEGYGAVVQAVKELYAGDRISVHQIAAKLKRPYPTVKTWCNMAAELGLVDYIPYKGHKPKGKTNGRTTAATRKHSGKKGTNQKATPSRRSKKG